MIKLSHLSILFSFQIYPVIFASELSCGYIRIKIDKKKLKKYIFFFMFIEDKSMRLSNISNDK